MTEMTERYRKAEGMLTHNLKKLVDSAQVVPVWIEDTDRFWYRDVRGEKAGFVLVDAAAGTKEPAFDHDRLAQALSPLLEADVEATQLPLAGLRFLDAAVRFIAEEQRIEVSLDSYEARVLGPAHKGESPSPDGRWSVGARDHELYIRDVETDEVRQLTTDGAAGYTYGTPADSCASRVMLENISMTAPPLVAWSPDGTKFVTHLLDQRDVALMHLVRSSPEGGGRPTLMSYRYAMVGEEQLATAEFFVFDAASGERTRASCEPVLMSYLSPLMLGHVWWNDAGTRAYWLASDRGDRAARLCQLDAATGAVDVLLKESSDTQVAYGPQFQDRNVRVLASGEVVWWSERTGWGHLYLYGTDGSCTQLTSGEWLVRQLVTVDEAARRLVFTAAGRDPGDDIYVQQLYSVGLDGGEITAITADGLDHDARPSRSGRFFVDVMSRVDVPGISVLRDRAGAVTMELEQADAAALRDAGYHPPERVVVKAADGVTDIWCAIYKPNDFDPDGSYPVLDEIYSGPQISCAPIRFPLSGGVMVAGVTGHVFPPLGFVVVMVDGRGTALRSRAFQDHSRLVRDADYIDDHVAAIRQLAETRPWMDLDRVGIYGHSGGGFASTKALLMQPDFYKVAVSSAGDHDDHTYHAWWGEKYYGLEGEFDYDAHANVALVENLKGKLFLAHGEMDDNVTPHLTMRLVDALIRANKDFDLLIVPNADHSLAHNNAYWLRRRWDYLVQHLMGEAPPPYRIADVPLDPERIAQLIGG